MELNNLTLFEARNIVEPVRRNWEWGGRGGNFLNAIGEALEVGQGRIGKQTLAEISNDALTLSTEKFEYATLPGLLDPRDWKDQRFRFVLEVILQRPTRYSPVTRRAIVQGYTDHADVSLSNIVDPKTIMYINSIKVLCDVDGGRGKRRRTSVVSDDMAILSPRIDEERMVRPSDVFFHLDIVDNVGVGGESDEDDDIFDIASSFVTGVNLSKRSNNTSSGFLSSLISADQDAAAMSEVGRSIDEDSRDELAADSAGSDGSTLFSQNSFFKAIEGFNRSVRRENSFRYKDLQAICQLGSRELDRRTEIVWIKSDFDFESEEWTGASAETVAAASAVQEIPSIASDCLMSSVEFSFDSLSRGSNIKGDFFIRNLTSMAGEDFSDRSIHRVLEREVRNKVIRRITNGYAFGIILDVRCDMYGMTRMELTIEDDPTVIHSWPTFMDSLLTAVVTGDKDNVSDLAEGYLEVRDVIDAVPTGGIVDDGDNGDGGIILGGLGDAIKHRSESRSDRRSRRNTKREDRNRTSALFDEL